MSDNEERFNFVFSSVRNNPFLSEEEKVDVICRLNNFDPEWMCNYYYSGVSISSSHDFENREFWETITAKMDGKYSIEHLQEEKRQLLKEIELLHGKILSIDVRIEKLMGVK
jgi:hypothetical protein